MLGTPCTFERFAEDVPERLLAAVLHLDLDSRTNELQPRQVACRARSAVCGIRGLTDHDLGRTYHCHAPVLVEPRAAKVEDGHIGRRHAQVLGDDLDEHLSKRAKNRITRKRVSVRDVRVIVRRKDPVPNDVDPSGVTAARDSSPAVDTNLRATEVRKRGRVIVFACPEAQRKANLSNPLRIDDRGRRIGVVVPV